MKNQNLDLPEDPVLVVLSWLSSVVVFLAAQALRLLIMGLTR